MKVVQHKNAIQQRIYASKSPAKNKNRCSL